MKKYPIASTLVLLSSSFGNLLSAASDLPSGRARRTVALVLLPLPQLLFSLDKNIKMRYNAVMKDIKKVEILDTTLRDGAQTVGVSFSLQDKLRIIERLANFGVEYIEAGNPASNPKDIEVFKKALPIFKDGSAKTGSQLVAFGATVRKGYAPADDENIAALLSAGTKTVSIFGKSHDLQVDWILKVSLEENLSMIRRTIEYLISQGRDVIFDAEHFFDGYKSNPQYAIDVLNAAAKAGACRVVLCDTNGGCFPNEIGDIVAKTVRAVNTQIGIHCHNDTGCAVANTLAAVKNGALHVQGTFNGIGERCGNANLSTLIPNLQLKMGYSCVGDSIRAITETAQFTAQVANVRLPRNMPYVGSTAFAHKGGMHVDGVMKNPKSFEHIEPEAVGNKRNLILSEMSGRGALLQKVQEYIPNLNKEDPLVAKLTSRVKTLEHEGYHFEAAGASFELLVLKEAGRYKPFFEIVDYKIVSTLTSDATADVTIKVGEHHTSASAGGRGPVNAMDKALRKALALFFPRLSEMYLSDYKVRIINGGDHTAAITRVLVESSDGNSTWTTVGAGDNIISASLIALVDSVEYALIKEQQTS